MDHRSIPGLICEATEHDQYRIVCAAGVLKSTLHRGAFFVDAIVDAIHLVPAVRICNFSRGSFSLNNISVIQ